MERGNQRSGDEVESRLRAISVDVRKPGTDYGTDSYWLGQFEHARGHSLGIPDVVALPTTVEQVSAILQLAAESAIPVVPWGAGSGSQGGALAIDGGIVVDLRGLNRLLDVDRESLTATVQSGMMSDAFEAALNRQNLTYPHYPASAAIATVGGYAACRGSGVMSTRYGKIEDLVLSVQVVLAGGQVIRTLPVPRHAVGPDLTQLFIGSEGTFGIITELTVRVMEQPESRLFHAIQFEDIHHGIEAARRLIQVGVRPSVMRLYDRKAAGGSLGQVIGEVLDRPTMVLVFEGPTGIAAAEAAVGLQIAAGLGSRSIDSLVARHWWDHRYDFYVPPHMPTLPSMWGTIEIVARYADINRIYDALQEEIPRRYRHIGLGLAIHLSHWYPWGTMIYGRFVVPEAPDDAEKATRLHDDIWSRAIRIAHEHGGVMNDHHGVGLKLGPFMRRQHGTAFGVLEDIKGVLDPVNVMNPGKLGFERVRRERAKSPVDISYMYSQEVDS